MDEILEDPEIIAQLDWLWSNNLGAHSEAANVVELSQQVDKGCVNEELKPIARYFSEKSFLSGLHLAFKILSF